MQYSFMVQVQKTYDQANADISKACINVEHSHMAQVRITTQYFSLIRRPASNDKISPISPRPAGKGRTEVVLIELYRPRG